MQAPVHHIEQQIILPWWRRLCRWLWKISGFLGTTVLLSLVVNVLATWLTSSRGRLPSDSPLALLFRQWPLLLAVGSCLILFALLTRILSQESTQSIATTRVIRHRERFLRRLANTYQQLEKQSFQKTTQITLKLADKTDAVQNATNLLLHTPHMTKQTPPTNLSIEQVYEEAAHELLILGEPGAGKSRLLYQLARTLVEQAKNDTSHPLPVLLPLASWAIKRTSIDAWIVDQLCSPLYGLPKQVSQRWVQSEQILCLFDGLDEMGPSARVACIRAINNYHHQHQAPLVICSRSAEYAYSSTYDKLHLQRAVVVQPLSDLQLTNLLRQAGKPFAGLRLELKKNVELRTLAKNPLWLNLLLMTYQGVAARTFSTQKESLQQQIFVEYVAHMMKRKGNSNLYSPRTIVMRLSWLAQHMCTHHQPIFYLETLQPDWLPQKQQRFYRVSIVIVCILITVLFAGLAWTMLAILFSWLFKGNIEVPLVGLLGTIPLSMNAGLIFGLFFSRRAIHPSEILTRSWKDSWMRLYMSMSIALSGGAAFLLSRRIVNRISGKPLTERLDLGPNEGIQRSAKNGITVGLTTGLFIGLIFGLIEMLVLGRLSELPVSLSMKLDLELFEGLFQGLFVGMLVGLVFGLGAYIQHYTLRFWLWRTRVFPWKAVPFLEDVTVRVLLTRIGGGYSFPHRLLLDYFANLNTTTL